MIKKIYFRVGVKCVEILVHLYINNPHDVMVEFLKHSIIENAFPIFMIDDYKSVQ